MPQLEFATYASQIFWLAIIFVVLYFYLAKRTLPVMREVLHNRQSRIAGDLKKAESLKLEAEAAEADFTSAISESRQKASKILNEAKVKIAAEEAERNARIEQNFVRQNKEAEQRALDIRKEATKKLIPVASAAAALMVEKLAGIKIDAKQAQEVAEKLSKEAAYVS